MSAHDHARDHEGHGHDHAGHSHSHSHGHGHDHAGHSHGVSADADARYLTIALLLIVGFMALEVVVGILAHSIALLSDAAHMLTDAGALALSIFVIKYVAKPGGEGFTYGRRRAEVLSGQANGAVLLVLGVLVIYESIARLITPPDVGGVAVTAVAAAGIAVNIAAAWVLAKANRQSLNIEGSFQHLLTDLYAFIGTFVAGVLIIAFGFDRADPIASLVVALLMVRSGYQLQRRAMRVLLEGAPEGMAPSEIGVALAHGEHVKEVHDLHVWELAPGHPILTAHVLVAKGEDCHAVRRTLERMLNERFHIEHTTLQIDHAQERLLSIQRHSPPSQ
jgi:cobalt-zinc-cadmium efflux system protein